MRRISFSILLVLSIFTLTPFSHVSFSHAQSDPQTSELVPSKFREAFYIPHGLRLKYSTYDCSEFIVTKQEEKDWNSFFAVITGFNDTILESRILKDIQTIDEAREYFEKYRKPIEYQGVLIQEVTLVDKNGQLYKLYWVGQKTFSSVEEAQKAIDGVKNDIEATGGNFAQNVQLAKDYSQSFTGVEHEVAKETKVIKVKPVFQQEEDVFFGAYDGLGLKRYWGKYPEEDWYLYQSVGETTYRKTNLDSRDFDSQVGFFNNRIVIRGVKFFGSSIDPYIEMTVRGETNSRPFATTLDLIAGFEYRPFRLNKWLAASPWTDWIRNFRGYILYEQREPVKDFIENARDHDVEVGFDFFKEWGIDMPKEGEKDTWLWGELFMNNRFRKTDFSPIDDYDSFVWNNAGKIGIKFPRFKVPKNSINDEFVVMPYMFFDETATSSVRSFFENRWFLGAGVRWMPFRSYRFLNSQWLFRMKIFGEYVGIGSADYTKDEPVNSVPTHDYRVGVNISLNRF